jgi:hypothetical protein
MFIPRFQVFLVELHINLKKKFKNSNPLLVSGAAEPKEPISWVYRGSSFRSFDSFAARTEFRAHFFDLLVVSYVYSSKKVVKLEGNSS